MASVKQYFFFSKEAGHLSYACPKNMLGEREPPKKKEKKKRKKIVEPEEVYVYWVTYVTTFFRKLFILNT